MKTLHEKRKELSALLKGKTTIEQLRPKKCWLVNKVPGEDQYKVEGTDKVYTRAELDAAVNGDILWLEEKSYNPKDDMILFRHCNDDLVVVTDIWDDPATVDKLPEENKTRPDDLV